MKKKVLTVVFAALLIAGGSQAVQAEETGGSLTLYMSSEEEQYYMAGIEEFRETYPEVELVIDSYGMNDLMSSAEKVKTQLMAGKGPDLLLMNSYGNDDVYKLLAAKVFASLDEFMTEENGWNREDYADTVIDGGRFEGAQYVMPLSYQVRLALASGEGLLEAEFDMDACVDTLSVMQETAKLYDLEYSNRILADLAQFMIFPQLLNDDFLDYSTGSLGVDNQELREACEAYARMYEEEVEENLGELAYYGYGKDILDHQAYICVPNGIDIFLMAATAIASEETPVILPLGRRDEGAAAVVMKYAGIRANSENQQNAWNMLRILLGEEMQRAAAEKTGYVSVRKSVLETDIQEKLKKALTDGREYTDVADPGSEFLEKYKNYLMNPGRSIFVSNLAAEKFYNSMVPFYAGEADYEECLAEFQEYVKIYLSE